MRVAVEAPQHSGISGPLDYLSETQLAPGSLLRVPLGKRELLGIVWPGASAAGTAEYADPAKLRAVLGVLEGLTPLSPSWCRLVEFAAAYYQRGVGELALSVLPPQLRELESQPLQLRLKRMRKWVTEQQAAPALASLQPILSPAQGQVLAQLDALLAEPAGKAAPPPVLLYGVTGSGKTEVYLRAAEHALAQGLQVLVLVPEINLTPQLEARFAERFGGRVLVSLHSGLTPAQRLRNWMAAHEGHADLVLGTRLAVFASMPRLGLIVVDEEH
ncbi:DEAD/DEAH box helicase, partial [Roseateles sp.]|uniref:primosomal protein N' family DNA-binding protein n=1 Tax=Roseateles sp. TaxID=1971397 RepID=UPI00286BB4B2